MKILGIDTTTKFLCLGIYDNGKIYGYNLELGRKHSALLIPTIKRVIDTLGWRLADIDYFACGLGPGSFTGIRVGLATIKGLSFALKKPIIGISTLDILAKSAGETDKPIVTIIDAKRNLIYGSIYKIKNGSLKRLTPYLLLPLNEFFKKIPKNTLILGDAVGLYKEKLLENLKGGSILDSDYWYPKAHQLIALALERIKQKRLSNSFNIKPIYLYPKECQIRA